MIGVGACVRRQAVWANTATVERADFSLFTQFCSLFTARRRRARRELSKGLIFLFSCNRGRAMGNCGWITRRLAAGRMGLRAGGFTTSTGRAGSQFNRRGGVSSDKAGSRGGAESAEKERFDRVEKSQMAMQSRAETRTARRGSGPVPGGRSRGVVALVEPATARAGRPGVSDSLGVAFAAAGRLAANRQPTADRGRTGGAALLR